MFSSRFSALLLSILLVLYCSSCEKEYVSVSDSRGVIDGRFISGGYVDVAFTRSIVPEKEGNLSDVVINWGKVTLSDGDKEVVLTGRMDSDRLPPFRYYNHEMIGVPDKIYTLKANFGDIEVESSARMPEPVPIDSIILSRADSDSLRSALLYFTSPEETPSYFYISLSSPGKAASPCMLGCITTERSNEKYSIAVLRPKQKIDSLKYKPHFLIGEEVTIHLNRVEKEVYDFWVAYDNMVMFSSSPFISTDESLPTNVKGGYGVWSPQGTSSFPLLIK